MIDVLHHLETPSIFFKEAIRVLKPGGRIIMLEPAITPLSWFFYYFFHQEDVDMSQDPFLVCKSNPNKDPYQSNQAIPSLLFKKHKARFKYDFPELQILSNISKRFSIQSSLRICLYVENGTLKRDSIKCL